MSWTISCGCVISDRSEIAGRWTDKGGAVWSLCYDHLNSHLDYADDHPETEPIALKINPRPVDVNGVPTGGKGDSSAPYCPAKPCRYCKGLSAAMTRDGNYLTSWDWCQEVKTCAATIDWERIYGRA